MKSSPYFENISPKTFILFSSAILVVLSFVAVFFLFRFIPYLLFIIIVLSYLISLMIVNFSFKIKEAFSLLLYPSLISVLFFLFYLSYEFLFSDIFISFIIYIIYFLILYASFIHISIINASKYEHIPLARFSYTINYVVSIFISYLGFLLLFSQKNILITLSLGLLFVYIVIFENIISLDYEISDAILYLLFGLILFLNIILLFMFYPISPFLSSLSLSYLVYVYIGILLHERLNNFLSLNYIEYYIFGIILFIALIFLPTWGIVGRF